MGIWHLIGFELRFQLRRPFVWFCFAGFFLLAFGDTVRTGWEGQGNLWINGAAIITNRAIILSLNGMLAVVGIMCDAMARDRIYGVEPLVLTTPSSRFNIGMGRFLASLIIVVATCAMIAPGIACGSLVPGIPRELVGPFVWQHYAKALAYLVIPNYFLMSALVFAVSSRWQNRSIAFGVGIATIAMWASARLSLGRDVLRQEVFTTYALLDPFGTIATWEFTMGRTVIENNTLFAPMTGTLLANRLIWTFIACALVFLGIRAVPLRPRIETSAWSRLRLPSWPRRRQAPAHDFGQSNKVASIRFSATSQLLAMVQWELQSIWRQPATKVCIGFLVFILWRAAASSITYQFSLPSTDLLVHSTSFLFDKILVLAIVWTAGELFWRDRSFGVNEVIDSQPTSDLICFTAKFVTLFAVIVAGWLLSIGVNVAYQATHGYYRFEWWLYFVDSFAFKAPYYLWLAVLALSCQAVIRNRYIGIGVVLLVYLSEFLLDAMNWFHPMVRFGRASHWFYSLMDGYGHAWPAHFWTSAYWSTVAVVIGVIGWGAYARGTAPQPRSWYWKQMLLSRRGAMALGSSLAAMVGIGAYLWYQSVGLANWPPLDEYKVNAEIERKYKSSWSSISQPRIVKIKGDLQLYPSQRRFELDGEYTIENQSDVSIEELLIPATAGIVVERIDLGPNSELISHDKELNVQHWRLAAPLEPGQRRQMAFRTTGGPPAGIVLHAKSDGIPEVSDVELVENGTSILNLRLMPGIGYSDRAEAKPAWKRRRLGLTEAWSAPSGQLAEKQGHALLHLGWVESIDMTIHTDADQIAVHSGELTDQWAEPNGRVAFRYQSTGRSRGWSSITSARYKQRRFEREDLPDVIVYFDPQHESSVDVFGSSIHDAMAYFAKRYGPPPFKTYRFAEQSLHYDGFGSRGGFGSSSEVLGWKSDLQATGGEDIKRMAALMMGMSWWGDQVIPANIAGAKVIHAGLPYWTAALCLHHNRDIERDRELRLQAMQEMFRGRSAMVDEEAPFVEEFKDSTLVRGKGSLLMLYLADLIGTDNLEAILAEFLEEARFREAPYPTAVELLDLLQERIPIEYHQQITDIFEKVTFWKLAVKNVESEAMADGRWRVTATVNAQKYYTSGWGEVEEADLETPVPLALFEGVGFAKEQVIWQDTQRLVSGENKIIVEVDQRPTRFGIDPYLLLVDPNPYDNVRRVE